MNLKDFKDNLAEYLFSMTKDEAVKQNVCIMCKKTPTFYSEAGRAEYRISGTCEPCFDSLFEDDNESK